MPRVPLEARETFRVLAADGEHFDGNVAAELGAVRQGLPRTSIVVQVLSFLSCRFSSARRTESGLLLYGDGLREVARLVDVAAAAHCDVVREQL